MRPARLRSRVKKEKNVKRCDGNVMSEAKQDGLRGQVDRVPSARLSRLFLCGIVAWPERERQVREVLELVGLDQAKHGVRPAHKQDGLVPASGCNGEGRRRSAEKRSLRSSGYAFARPSACLPGACLGISWPLAAMQASRSSMNLDGKVEKSTRMACSTCEFG